MFEFGEDILGMQHASEYLVDNPNAPEIPFNADAATRFLSLYLQTIPDVKRPQETMRLERVFDDANSREGIELGVAITRQDYILVRNCLLAEKARRDQLAFPT